MLCHLLLNDDTFFENEEEKEAGLLRGDHGAKAIISVSLGTLIPVELNPPLISTIQWFVNMSFVTPE